MAVTIDGREASTDEWLEGRRTFIGGSDIAMVLGLKPSRLKAWLSKLSPVEEDRKPTKAQRRGLRLERYIAEGYGELTGDPIVRQQVVFRHPTMPWIGATVDGVTASGRIVEFKTSGAFGPVQRIDGPDDFEAIPDIWTAQGAHQLLAAERPDMDFAVVTSDLELSVIGPWPRPDSLCDVIARECRTFWEGYVLTGIPPDEIEAADADLLARAFRGETGEALELGEDERMAAEAYRDLGAEIRGLEKERDAAKARLLLAMGDAAVGTLPDGGTVSRKVITSEYPAREAETRTSVRLYVKGPR